MLCICNLWSHIYIYYLVVSGLGNKRKSGQTLRIENRFLSSFLTFKYLLFSVSETRLCLASKVNFSCFPHKFILLKLDS